MGMELTGLTATAYRIWGPRLKKKARADYKLCENLEKAQMTILPEAHLAVSRLYAVMSIVISVLVLGLLFVGVFPIIEGPNSGNFFADFGVDFDPNLLGMEGQVSNQEDIDKAPSLGRAPPPAEYEEMSVAPKFGAIGVAFIIPFIVYLVKSGEPKRRTKERANKLETQLPYAASFVAAMAAANATPEKIFRSLAVQEKIYGEVAKDAAMLYRDLKLLGLDLITALKNAVRRAPSSKLADFFQGMIGTLSAGGNLKLYFLNRAEFYMRDNRAVQEEFLQSIGVVAESYVVVAVAMPLFLIVLLIIMYWVSPTGEGDPTLLYGVIFGLLPMIHFAYGILVATGTPEI